MKNNNSAFPLPNGAGDDGRQGMKLRDYFAAQVLIGEGPGRSPAARLAARAYEVADAMLAERTKGEKP